MEEREEVEGMEEGGSSVEEEESVTFSNAEVVMVRVIPAILTNGE